MLGVVGSWFPIRFSCVIRAVLVPLVMADSWVSLKRFSARTRAGIAVVVIS